MKTAALIIVVIIAIAAFYVRPWDFWGATKAVLLPPQGDITLIDTGGPGHYTADPPERHTFAVTSPEALSVLSWIRDHQTGWHVSLADYAPHTKLSCDTFTLDIQGNALILNYARRKGSERWMQIVRSLSREEQSFWQSFIARVERPNQALERTADRRQNLLSMTSIPKSDASLALVSGRSACSR